MAYTLLKTYYSFFYSELLLDGDENEDEMCNELKGSLEKSLILQKEFQTDHDLNRLKTKKKKNEI